MRLTTEQQKLARHALGLDNPAARGRSYRNVYVAGRGSAAEAEWEAMVGLGAAVFANAGMWSGTYQLTRAGAEAALKARERLDPEDFPEEVTR